MCILSNLYVVKENLNTPFKFPNGEKVLRLIPQIVTTRNATDVYGNPLAVEVYGFDPMQVLKELTQEEYTLFIIYALELKALFLEQESEIRERAYLEKHAYNPPEDPRGYGVILQHCIIRDFAGFTIAGGFKCKRVLEWILPIALDNYPEMMFRSHMINMPYGFTTFFNFICLFLDPRSAMLQLSRLYNMFRTKAKITMNYKDFKAALKDQITEENIPESIGGSFTMYNEPYEFDLSPGSALYYKPRDGYRGTLAGAKYSAEDKISTFGDSDSSEAIDSSDITPLEEVNIRLSFSNFANV